MTECNGCGRCCDPFTSVASPLLLETREADEVVGEKEADWMREHLTPIRRSDGLRAVSDWMDGQTWFMHLPEPAVVLTWFYRCDLYDFEAKRCTDYENRPPMCRDFPWFGTQPSPKTSLPPECSFNADVGKPVKIATPSTGET